MSAIVSDTTPLNYLVLIEAVDLLPRLCQRVLIPPAVRCPILDDAETQAIALALEYRTELLRLII